MFQTTQNVAISVSEAIHNLTTSSTDDDIINAVLTAPGVLSAAVHRSVTPAVVSVETESGEVVSVPMPVPSKTDAVLLLDALEHIFRADIFSYKDVFLAIENSNVNVIRVSVEEPKVGSPSVEVLISDGRECIV